MPESASLQIKPRYGAPNALRLKGERVCARRPHDAAKTNGQALDPVVGRPGPNRNTSLTESEIGGEKSRSGSVPRKPLDTTAVHAISEGSGVDDDSAAQAGCCLALHDASNYEHVSSYLTPLNQNQVAIDDEIARMAAGVLEEVVEGPLAGFRRRAQVGVGHYQARAFTHGQQYTEVR